MTRVMTHRAGTVDWLELSTPDPEAAVSFYSALLGWNVTRHRHGRGEYFSADVGGFDAAGIVPQHATIGDLPLPATWNVLIRVDDIGDAVARVRDLGGRLIEPIHDIPEVGLMATVCDPGGAAFVLAQNHIDFGIAVQAEPGAIVWSEILTRDPDAAARFYTSLFGWTTEGALPGPYVIFMHADVPVAGLLAMPADLPSETPSQWLPYFEVADGRAVVRDVAALGGKVLAGLREIQVGRFAVLEDPMGAVFAVLESTQHR